MAATSTMLVVFIEWSSRQGVLTIMGLLTVNSFLVVHEREHTVMPFLDTGGTCISITSADVCIRPNSRRFLRVYTERFGGSVETRPGDVY